MATAPQVGQTIEMEAILRLAPARSVTRADLEDATMEVERVLEQYALEITDGASASANFETPSIEIDIVLTGGSIGELYQKVASSSRRSTVTAACKSRRSVRRASQ